MAVQTDVLVDICEKDNDRYMYGFNGQVKDNEWAGIGNFMDFGERRLDSRTSRWLALDPLSAKYPGMSPYNFVANSPIMFIDPDGRIIRIYYEGGKSYDYTPGVKPAIASEILLKAHEAITYNMNTSTGAWIWTRLHNSKGVIAIQGEIYDVRKHSGSPNRFNLNASPNGWGGKEFDGKQRIGTIVWDYKSVLAIGEPGGLNEGYFAPSTALLHEAGHADEAAKVFASNDITQLRTLIQDTDENMGADEQYDTKEERRNSSAEHSYIKEINAWQKKNGGTRPFYQPIREHHKALPIRSPQTENVNRVDEPYYDEWIDALKQNGVEVPGTKK